MFTIPRPLASAALALVLGAAVSMPASADPITLGTLDRTYGTGDSAPFAGGQLRGDRVTVRNRGNGSGFVDAFDLSGFAPGAVSALELTLELTNVNSRTDNRGRARDEWSILFGADPTVATFDSFSTDLESTNRVFTVLLDATTDTTGTNVFDEIMAAQRLAFRFEDATPTRDAFQLYSASLRLVGDAAGAVVPLPAAGWLLLTALGGLGVAGWRRRRARA
jgi:hypothetical protein